MTNLHLLKPVIANSDAMQGPAQIDNVANFAEQGWHFRQGTGAERGDLTVDELHAGLVWKDTDGLEGLYGRNAANNGWTVLYLPGIKRHFLLEISQDSKNAGDNIGSIDFGTVSVARRIVVDMTGTVGFAGNPSQRAGVTMTPTNGTIVRPGAGFDETIDLPNAAQWYSYALRRTLDFPAGAHGSVTFTATQIGGSPTYFRFGVDAAVLLAGEY